MRTLLVAAALAALVIVPSVVPAPAQAQPSNTQKAAEHYKAAEAAMGAGLYVDAAREYAIAYEITNDPILFYWIATANDKAGKCEIAMTYYRRYLKEGKPNDEYRKLTDERITECQKRLDPGKNAAPKDTASKDATPKDTRGKDTPAAEPGPTATPPPPDTTSDTSSLGALEPPPGDSANLGPSLVDEKPSWKKSAGWITVGVGVASATVGTVMLLSARSTERDIEDLIAFRGMGRPATFDSETKAQYEKLIDEGNRFNTLAAVAFGVSGAAAVGATLFFILDDSGEKRQRPAPALLITPGGAGISAAFHF